MKLLHIDAPHFCAGAIIVKGKITEAAPIIYYMKNWKSSKAHSYCEQKGWKSFETPVDGEQLIEF